MEKLSTSKLCCTICSACKGVSKDRLEKLIGQFGSLEILHDKYVCRSCRKTKNVRSDGKLKPEKRTRQPKPQLEKTPEGKIVLPKGLVGPIEKNFIPVSGADLYRPTDGPVCHRPDIFIVDRCCNGCTLFEFCNSTGKNIKDIKPKKKRG